MQRLRVESGTGWENRVGYSRAIRVGDGGVGDHVLVAGTTATDEEGVPLVDADPAEQTRVALATVRDALNEAGSGMEDVVRTRLFVTDIDTWPAIGEAHGEVFGDVRPASTMVEVDALVEPGLVVEIEAEAVVGAGTE
jgi:enamine deaminase RidA (YjgF/YER057c/UK114 family)